MGCCESTPDKKQTLLITNNYNFTFTNTDLSSKDYNSNLVNNLNNKSHIKSERYKKLSDSINNKKNFKNLNKNNNQELNNNISSTEIIESYALNYKEDSNIYKDKNNINTNSIIILNNGNVEIKSIDVRNKNITNNYYSRYYSKTNSNQKSISAKSTDIPKLKHIALPNNEIPKHIIESRKKLIITFIESKYIEYGTKLVINAGGLETSERMCSDGVVLFGNKVKQISNKSLVNYKKDKVSKKIENDFNFPEEEKIGEKVFEIKYFISDDKYKIKNLYGSGLFLKVKQTVLLTNNTIFSFVNSHVLVKIPIELNNINSNNFNSSSTNSKIIFKFLYGEYKNEEFVFNSDKSSTIIFGRKQEIYENNKSFIAFNDSNVSRIQSTVFYDNKTMSWYLTDSNGELNSLNGTWIIFESYKNIEESDIFRVGTTSFQCSYLKNNNSLDDNELINGSDLCTNKSNVEV